MDEFLVFQEQMQAFYQNETGDSHVLLITQPEIGQMCVAKWSDDQQWYRAIVKSVDLDTNSVCVFFVDYGNEEKVTIDSGLLEIDDQFKDYPRFGLKCCLNGVKPNSSDLVLGQTQNVADFLFESLEGTVYAKFVDTFMSDCYLVDLQVERTIEAEDSTSKTSLVNVADLLVERAYVSLDTDKTSDRKKALIVANNKRLAKKLIKEKRGSVDALPLDNDKVFL
jgi:hypothetical protein